MRTLFTTLLLMAAMAVQAQEPTAVPFNGIVTDITGAPLRGAKVYVDTPSYFARSDKKGRFGLTNVQEGDTLHVLYRRKLYVVPVNGRKSIRIRLGDQVTPEAAEDQDLVNWGYGFVRRRESLEVSKGISGDVLVRTGKINVLDALQGLVPGLNITPTYGSADPKVNIRGINSLYAAQTPIYLVDGVEVESLEYVNIYDVDHVEVLKDATIYGARGANGAILVTTKQGGTRKK